MPVQFSIYCAIFLLVFCSLPLPHLKNRVFTFRSLANDMGINPLIFYWLILVLVVVAVVLYFYSNKYLILGSMILDTEHLIINDLNNQSTIYRFDEVEKLKISRGSTVHKTDNGIFGPETNDNWITFVFQKRDYQFEFSILNEAENDAFENVVYKLRSVVDGFVYTSI